MVWSVAVRERLPCEFFLIRYVPDVVKGEFANIGVVLREVASAGSGGAAAEAGGGRTIVKFTRDWARVRCLDSDADVGLLEALEAEIALRLEVGVTAAEAKPVLAVLEDTLSNAVQITEARACLAESLGAEMEQLMRLYVEPLRVRTEKRRATGRAAVVGSLRSEFERAGVWSLMRKRIAASEYTGAGDPMRLDCGYRVDASGSAAGFVRMFQAVSLEGDVEGAKGLAYSASRLRAGVERVERVGLELTAVVEPVGSLDAESEAVERWRFGVDAMEREAIRVVTVADLARVAATARVELRV
jgi:hypothetical protein